MTPAERRFITTGFGYLAGSQDEVDARDAWYTARDLMTEPEPGPVVVTLRPATAAEAFEQARRWMESIAG